MPQERKKKQFSVRVYNQKHLRNLSKRLRKVQRLLDEAARKGAAIGARTGYKDITKDFRFDDFPQARREIDALLRELSTALTMNVEEADSEAWGMANAKNDAMVDAMLASTGVDMARKTTQPWYNKNARALGAFQKRVKDGMNLSTDVWNLGQFKGELELALEMGLGRGKSAAELSRDVRSFLKYPDKLFRRVRDEKGVLRLSKAAREFHPGRGVYRSSYKNALRVTATETNMAYRTADSKRWQQIPFVLGIKIQVSKTNHPVTDICDELAGDYPKDFVFTGWHPFCKCFATSILPAPEKFLEYQQAILDGKDVSDWQWEGEVKDVPGKFNTWVKDNEERIAKAKSMPYFLKDNQKYVETESLHKNRMALQSTEVLGVSELTAKELNQLSGDLYEVSRKTGIFGKGYEIGFSDFSDGTLMQWKDGKLTISTVRHKLEDGTVFCPVENLRSAIGKLRRGKTLDFCEEYSIESLFHESVHARVTRKTVVLAGSMDEKIMETCTQLYARDRYVKILKAYKVDAVNFERIKTDGLGYNLECSKLRGYFTKNGRLQVGELINIANETESGTRMMMKKLIGMGLKEEDALKLLIKLAWPIV